MSRTRKFAVRFGGGGTDVYHDSRINIKYFNVFANANADDNKFPEWNGGKVEDYRTIYGPFLSDPENFSNFYPLIYNGSNSNYYNLSSYQGLAPIGETRSQQYTIYRREYEVYLTPGAKKYGYFQNNNFYEEPQHIHKLTPYSSNITYIDENTGYAYKCVVKNLENNEHEYFFTLTERAKVFKGEWEPVVLNSNDVSIYDYNIVNGKTYQYMLHLGDNEYKLDDNAYQKSIQLFANSDETYKVWMSNEELMGQGKLVDGSSETSNILGSPVSINWSEWNICELIPESFPDNAPLIKKVYKVNQDQIWKFRFSLETGGQKQNIGRSEFQTLGQFPKVGYGKMNYASGNVSALLGSEIVLGTKNKYTERLSGSRISPLSTNEKVKMLEQWHKFVSSNNPKLLRDMKGQSWIVQVMSAENTVKNFYNAMPDTISFEWKQIDDTKNIIIYSPVEDRPEEVEKIGSLPYEPLFGKKN